MAKKGLLRRLAEKVAKPFKRKPKEESKKAPAPAPAKPGYLPKVGATPSDRAQSYIDDLHRRGKKAVYPTDETTEFWRAFDERGGTP